MQVRCTRCTRLLPVAYFTLPERQLLKRSRDALCKGCLRQCVVCTRRLDDDEAVGREPEARVCEKCAMKRDTANTNLFYRYPQLRHRWSPHDQEELRRKMEDDSLPPPPEQY